MKKFFYITLLLSLVTANIGCFSVLADSASIATDNNSFVINHIKVVGLQRISQQTFYHYLPLTTGQSIDDNQSSNLINKLYQTGFFSNIVLQRQGDVLTIIVKERPVISNLVLKGNKTIKTSDLQQALRGSGVAIGLDYNPQVIDEVHQVLLHQYLVAGKYNAKVKVVVRSLPRNRVNLDITISEGDVARVKQVTILGTHVFSEKELLKHFSLNPSSKLFENFSQRDVYSQTKLQQALTGLRNFYLDHGYIKYRMIAKQVSITPNRLQIYITVTISEGKQYKISSYEFSGDQTILSSKQLHSLAALKKGEVFSRQKILNAERSIIIALGNKGYAHAKVTIDPSIDDKSHTVHLTLHVVPGQLVYINHITFSGNNQTKDSVLRRRIQQLEGGLSSTTLIAESKQTLLRLPYIRKVDMKTKPVANHPNEEDIDYKVTEYPAASFNASAGYADVGGILFNVGLNQKNFLGTGNMAGIDFTRSQYLTQYNLSYYNPYYTDSGIGRGFNLSYSKYRYSKADISDYDTSIFETGFRYSIPVSNRVSYQLGYSFQALDLEIGNSPSMQVADFVNQFGLDFYQVLLNAGLTYNSFDRAIFPTQGLLQQLNLTLTLPVSKDKSLRYYQGQYRIHYYQPLYKRRWIATAKAVVGYAHGYGIYSNNYPFFNNFFAGGMSTVRGYSSNTLGPKDSAGNPLGGNVLLYGSAGIIFPNPISKSIRTTWFVDSGNVYDTNNSNLSAVKLQDLRYSSGVEVDWLTPLGITVSFALAQAINPSDTDSTQFFGFTLQGGIS